MLENIVQRMGRKRTAAVALLAIAAIGASRVPGHRTVADDGASKRARIADSDQALVLGSNNLLGAVGSNSEDGTTNANQLSEEHFVSDMSLSQAGDSGLLRQLHSLTEAAGGLNDASLAANNVAAASINASAVPEPTTVALLSMLAVPALIRRRRGTTAAQVS